MDKLPPVLQRELCYHIHGNILKSLPVLSWAHGFEDVLQQISTLLVERVHWKGDILFRLGERSHQLYVLTSGSVWTSVGTRLPVTDRVGASSSAAQQTQKQSNPEWPKAGSIDHAHRMLKLRDIALKITVRRVQQRWLQKIRNAGKSIKVRKNRHMQAPAYFGESCLWTPMSTWTDDDSLLLHCYSAVCSERCDILSLGRLDLLGVLEMFSPWLVERFENFQEWLLEDMKAIHSLPASKSGDEDQQLSHRSRFGTGGTVMEASGASSPNSARGAGSSAGTCVLMHRASMTRASSSASQGSCEGKALLQPGASSPEVPAAGDLLATRILAPAPSSLSETAPAAASSALAPEPLQCSAGGRPELLQGGGELVWRPRQAHAPPQQQQEPRLPQASATQLQSSPSPLPMEQSQPLHHPFGSLAQTVSPSNVMAGMSSSVQTSVQTAAASQRRSWSVEPTLQWHSPVQAPQLSSQTAPLMAVPPSAANQGWPHQGPQYSRASAALGASVVSSPPIGSPLAGFSPRPAMHLGGISTTGASPEVQLRAAAATLAPLDSNSSSAGAAGQGHHYHGTSFAASSSSSSRGAPLSLPQAPRDYGWSNTGWSTLRDPLLHSHRRHPSPPP